MSCPPDVLNGDQVAGIALFMVGMFYLGWLAGRMYQIWRG